MNVGQLEKMCASINDKTMDVFIKQANTEYHYSMAQTAEVKGVKFKGEGIPKKEEPTVECLVITDSY